MAMLLRNGARGAQITAQASAAFGLNGGGASCCFGSWAKVSRGRFYINSGSSSSSIQVSSRTSTVNGVCLLGSQLQQRVAGFASKASQQKNSAKMSGLPRVFMDIEAEGTKLGRIVMEVSVNLGPCLI